MRSKVFAQAFFKSLIAFSLFIANMVVSGCELKQPEFEYPNFTLTSSTGEPVSLDSFRHESIVVLGIGNPYT